jgi:hypothetical protein
VLPNTQVISNGFTIGSDAATGLLQMRGAINSMTTYNYAQDADSVSAAYVLYEVYYLRNLGSLANFTNAPFSPGYSDIYDVVTGPGYLLVTGTNATTCVSNSNVWITNEFVTPGTNNSFNLGFTVAGGNPDLPYDVFGTAYLTSPLTNSAWTWLGQAYPCQTNVIVGLTNKAVYLLLGTPLDSAHNGLTDAFQLLVLHINPYNSINYDGGMPVAWCVLQGLNSSDPNLANEDPDQDGLSNLQEYLYGTNPLVPEGTNIWVSEPLMTSSIP